jgi:hypothetical protein
MQQSFDMHRLAQLSMRRWLEADKHLDQRAKESRTVLNAAFPRGDYGTWADCQVLFPHAVEATNHAAKDDRDELNLADIVSRMG